VLGETAILQTQSDLAIIHYPKFKPYPSFLPPSGEGSGLLLRVWGRLFVLGGGRFVSELRPMRKVKKPKPWVIVLVMEVIGYGTSAEGRRAL
jgi:hypothetical protein